MTDAALPWGSLPKIFLAALADGASNGADIMRWISDRTNGTYAPGAGTVYPRLTSLEIKGLVQRIGRQSETSYRLTPLGRDRAEETRDEVATILKELASR